MRTRWFDRPLDTIAMLWRVERRDGVTLGFATHDRDLSVDHIVYHAAPGMLPSAIEMDDGLDPLDMDIAGALSHALIRSDDLAAGRWDHAAVAIGLVDWQDPASGASWFWHGHLGAVSLEPNGFSAELRGLKARLDQPYAPAASPSCRADFCGPGCGLSRAAHERVAAVTDATDEGATFELIDAVEGDAFVFGQVRWVTGRNTGLSADIVGQSGGRLQTDDAWPVLPQPGDRALLLEGCDKSLATCAGRFGNALNFRGEPHLPGNDLLTRFVSF
jgi:uncharacterized phage protein (TIGR02218 family)